MPTSTPTALPHIVVLGAGFAGLNFCRRLQPGLARITLIDRQNHHLFQPLLYQVAAAGLAVPDIAQPIRAILRDVPDLTVLMAEVHGIDLAARRVKLDHGELAYDYLVIALGARTSYSGRPEWETVAPGLKSIDDAVRIRRDILLAYERAETEPDEARRTALMTTVIVGGGPTGVELAGTFAELARNVLHRDFDHIDPTKARVVLFEGGDRLLKTCTPDLSAHARRHLEKLGVEVRTGERVKDIRDQEVVLEGETIRAANIIWAAGVASSPVTATLGVPIDRSGRILVNPDLSLPEHPEAFAAGDLVSLVDANGVEVPGVAQGGVQMGAHIARVLTAQLRALPHDPPPRPAFAYHDKGSMATIGRSQAVAQIGRLHFSGWPAWIAWLVVHLLFLIGLRNKVSVLLSWTYSYFTYKRGARIITGASSSGLGPNAPRPPVTPK
jgi:NADH dehydrogenase